MLLHGESMVFKHPGKSRHKRLVRLLRLMAALTCKVRGREECYEEQALVLKECNEVKRKEY